MSTRQDSGRHEAQTTAPDPRLVALLLLAAVIARVWLGPRPVDDAYITWRYSEHVASGLGFTYNPPARVLGTTTPFFTLLLAGSTAAGVPAEYASFALATLADVATIAGMVVLLSGAGAGAAGLIAGAFIAISPAYSTYSISGMETSLYVSLLVLTLTSVRSSRMGAAGACAGFASLCRPDGVLLMFIVPLALAKVRRPGTWRFLLAAALVIAPWAIFSTLYFGSPIPSSVLAKRSLEVERLVGLRTFVDYFFTGTNRLITLAAIPGGWLLWRRGDAACRLWLAWSACYAAAFVGFNAFTHFPWYFVPLLPAYFACAAVAIVATAGGALRRYAPALTFHPGLSAAVAVLVLACGGVRLMAHSRYLTETARGRERLYEQVARELADDGERCQLAATEIGALGYFYRGPILDLVGLVSPESIGRDMGDVLRESRARWLVTYDTHFPREILQRAWFERTFALRSVRPVFTGRHLEIYERREAEPCR